MTWQQELATSVREAADLLRYIPLTAVEQAAMAQVLDQFPMSITSYYLSLIDFSDPDDPIRRMSIPSVLENDLSGSFDTSGEASNTVIPGMQHKYSQTALILSTNQCAMYCRHCFRKRLVGLSDDEIAQSFSKMREYVSQHPEISNVLISGGDALLNSNARLRQILSLFTDIEHVDAIRIASRVPVVFPSRISGDEELLQILQEANTKKQLVFVTQYNHPRELTQQSLAAVKAIQSLGIPVKNQAVLLRGVNDNTATLSALLKSLIRNGILPYYVFQCRPVSGVKSQFQVPLAEGIKIVHAAQKEQNGLGKSFRYCLSHVTGKIEILGEAGQDELLFQYHEAHDPAQLGKFFTRSVSSTQTWLDEASLLK